jgi:hypothetical protein
MELEKKAPRKTNGALEGRDIWAKMEVDGPQEVAEESRC